MTDWSTPRPQRPEPLGRAAVEPLAGRAQTIAKGWLLLLLERAELDAVGAIPAAALAAEGPALCAAVVRALGSDAELDRLQAGGDLAPLAARIGPLAGAADAAAVVAAVDALRACVWSVALDGGGMSAQASAVRALGERLAEVTAVLTAAAVGGATASPAGSAPVADAIPQVGADAARTGSAPAPAVAPQPGSVPAPAAAPLPGSAPAPAAASHGSDPAPASADPAPAASHDASDAPAFATPADLDRFPPPRNGGDPAGEPAPTVHDLRAPAGDGTAASASVTQLPQRPAEAAGAMDDGDLWIATLERHVDRCQREGGGLALLRVELVDAERVAASAPEEQSHVPYGRLAQAVRRAIRRQDLVASDHHGRAWVIAPGVGRAGAIALAERIGAGVEHGETWRGGPLAATIGFAVYGEDGRDAATLIDRAEEAMLAATAAGVRIGEAIPQPDGGGGDGPSGGPRLVR